MVIINLVEDTKGDHCLSEHGLSFYIETEKHKLLMIPFGRKCIQGKAIQ